MRVFLAGATGAIGAPLSAALLDAGHEVVALTRSAERGQPLRERGARIAVADALDAGALRAAVLAAEPDVVVNQLTALPKAIDPVRYRAALAPTSRLRREATPVLAAAAAASGARLVSQSVSFMLEPAGPWVRDETAPLDPAPPRPAREALASMRALERATLGMPGGDGLVLRYGFFYGPGTAYAPDGSIAHEVRRRRFPLVGDGEGRFSFIHVDDAVRATRLAIERGERGVLHVTDDEPAPMRDWLPGLAEMLGAPAPRRVPAWLVRLVAPAGASAAVMRGASNARARERLGWEPVWRDWRAGFAEVFGAPRTAAGASA